MRSSDFSIGLRYGNTIQSQVLLHMTTSLTSKGQVTIPKAVRDYLGLKPGAGVDFERLASGQVVLKPARKGGKPRKSVFAGLRGRATVRMKTDEILALTRGR
jgi:antitoxin PrlF